MRKIKESRFKVIVLVMLSLLLLVGCSQRGPAVQNYIDNHPEEIANIVAEFEDQFEGEASVHIEAVGEDELSFIFVFDGETGESLLGAEEEDLNMVMGALDSQFQEYTNLLAEEMGFKDLKVSITFKVGDSVIISEYWTVQ